MREARKDSLVEKKKMMLDGDRKEHGLWEKSSILYTHLSALSGRSATLARLIAGKHSHAWRSPGGADVLASRRR